MSPPHVKVYCYHKRIQTCIHFCVSPLCFENVISTDVGLITSTFSTAPPLLIFVKNSFSRLALMLFLCNSPSTNTFLLPSSMTNSVLFRLLCVFFPSRTVCEKESERVLSFCTCNASICNTVEICRCTYHWLLISGYSPPVLVNCLNTLPKEPSPFLGV